MKEQKNPNTPTPPKGSKPKRFDPREDLVRAIHDGFHHAISCDEALETIRNTLAQNPGGMNSDLYEYLKAQEQVFEKERLEALDRVRILDSRVEALSKAAEESKNERISECLTLGKISGYINKNIPITQHELLEFLVITTANIGELQGRIDSLPDTVEWKKDALEKLDALLGEVPGDLNKPEEK